MKTHKELAEIALRRFEEEGLGSVLTSGSFADAKHRANMFRALVRSDLKAGADIDTIWAFSFATHHQSGWTSWADLTIWANKVKARLEGVAKGADQ